MGPSGGRKAEEAEQARWPAGDITKRGNNVRSGMESSRGKSGREGEWRKDCRLRKRLTIDGLRRNFGSGAGDEEGGSTQTFVPAWRGTAACAFADYGLLFSVPAFPPPASVEANRRVAPLFSGRRRPRFSSPAGPFAGGCQSPPASPPLRTSAHGGALQSPRVAEVGPSN